MSDKVKDAKHLRAKEEADRLRYDAQHHAVDALGDDYEGHSNEPGTKEPAIGGDRAPRAAVHGTLDPYHRDDPGENQPRDSAAKPKAPVAHEVTEDGRLAEPRAPRGKPQTYPGRT